ncbi:MULTISPECIES: FliA/WhiG family RNA polymerase sigma factor [Sphingomonadales]|uniref:FliA/WhiG family RNA polymerase sigma factor n=2 Tax=Edaphosphingomonas TaxID=3423724 RepID=A0A2T4I7J9_9SPHN|nr:MULTISPECIES: FliA/WhiG family RNA polymerase sigma factor [Sphingomonas]AGH48919.1 RNA polymerase sigma 28 subunit FliA/WhiG [Sphingomonas sp. MM-1]OHT21335.1 RNA polymerase sigma factor FliA [Sphingomonas haloaromaticamans]PTD27310.1 FliA/WhiG family RNA polymerase sigma factor [Sphingomonas fennica]
MAFANAAISQTYQRRPARARPGDLAREHMPLVRRIAWHVHGRVSNAIDIEDLVQIGMVALVEAANNFEDRGFAFSTYATTRIRGAMIDHLRRHANICRSAMSRRREIARVRARLEQALGRPATDAEMADAMGLSAADYREAADSTAAVRQESLDEVYSDQSMWFADIEERVDQTLERDELRDLLAGHIAELPEREALVLQLYFVEEMNLDEIGLTLGVGAARVCQIKKAALDRLRARLADHR